MHRVLCILIALVVGLPTAALARAYRCASDGEVRTACCCPEAEESADGADDTDEPASIRARCCCDVIDGAGPAAKVGRAGAPDGPRAPAQVVLASVSIVAAPPVGPPPRELADRSRPPPPHDARLFVAHCSLLI